MRILVFAHNHPEFHLGGTEIFAHDLFKSYQRAGAEALFVAATNALHREPRPGTRFQTVGPSGDEVVVWAGHFDRFYLSQTDSFGTLQDMARLFAEFDPDVLHIHHLLLGGAELPFLARRVLPRARIVLTLHDDYPICHHDGLMLRVGTGEPCRRASPSNCRGCFPAIGADRFLRERYVEWGLPAERIEVVRNARPAADPATARPRAGPVAFGYFGNLSPWKGVPVLLRAARILREGGTDFRLRLHGGAPFQNEAFLTLLDDLAEPVGDRLPRLGPYERTRVPELMAEVDAVVVPSIWCENAPLVIQEAFQHRRPAVVSGIGGMAEMVREGVDGFHARPNDPHDLARAMRRLAEEPDLLARLAANVEPPPDMDRCAAEHLALFARERNEIGEFA